MMSPMNKALACGLIGALSALSVSYAADKMPTPCDQCAAWNAPQKPFKVFGNTYYVGPHGLSSILITSDQGHVLIDGALPESAAQIATNIAALGFRIQDVKLILNSHVHFDHAGGIAKLQSESGARVAASASSAKVLESGHYGSDDPQYGGLPPIAPVKSVQIFKDGETLKVGPIAITAHATPGHTPGGTSWTWKSCEGARCLNMAYVDSLSPISADGFKFSEHNGVREFTQSYATIAKLPCDILLTPHPDVSQLFQRIDENALVDTSACSQLVDNWKKNFEKRLATEAQTH
jgi:metallo-beta-lactamase class B